MQLTCSSSEWPQRDLNPCYRLERFARPNLRCAAATPLLAVTCDLDLSWFKPLVVTSTYCAPQTRTMRGRIPTDPSSCPRDPGPVVVPTGSGRSRSVLVGAPVLWVGLSSGSLLAGTMEGANRSDLGEKGVVTPPVPGREFGFPNLLTRAGSSRL